MCRTLLLSSFVAQAAYAAVTPASFVSSLDNSLQLTQYIAPVLGAGNASAYSSSWGLTVDDTPTGYKQTMDGFGAAVTDATVTVFNALSPSKLQSLLVDLFSPTGINFNFMRHTIGCSDLSSYVYTYDDVSIVDPQLRLFKLGPAGTAMAALLKSMRDVNPAMKLLGSVWSPPAWMKLNGVIFGTTVNNNLNAAWSSSYAQYFVDYIRAFGNAGVPVDAITIQNEPLNSNGKIPTMYISAENATTLIGKFVGPALRNANLSTQIWAYDHNTDVPSYPQMVLDDAGNYTNTVAWHCYATNNNWGVLTAFHKSNPKVMQYMTECWLSPLTSWYSSIYFIMGPLQNWAAGAMGWTLGTTISFGPYLPNGCNTCRGIVEVDLAAGTYIKTLDYYFFGQFSKFIQRGSTALATTGSYDFNPGNGVQTIAFLNADKSRTIVIYNGFGNDVYVTIAFKSGETWSGPLYYYSLTTWVLPPSVVA